MIFITRTGQWGNCLKLLLWVVVEKMEWDEAMGRLDGSYYLKQVRDAAKEYNDKQPSLKTDETFGNWLKENPK